MGCLVDKEIQDYLDCGLILKNYKKELINPASIDVTLGNKIGIIKAKKEPELYPIQNIYDLIDDYVIDPLDPESFETKWIDLTCYAIQPGQFLLSFINEEMNMPVDLCARALGKSSLARFGLDFCSPGGFIDPEFKGRLVIELTNHGEWPIILRPNMKIGQLVFSKTETPSKTYEETGRYQNQEECTGSKGIT